MDRRSKPERTSRPKLNKSDAERLWQAQVTFHHALILKHDGELAAQGLAQLAAEHAGAALIEWKRRTGGRHG